MTQAQAVIETIDKLGGIATLNQINQNIFKVENVKWNTKTHFASVRRIVQQTAGIYKIKPGLYALETYRKQLEQDGVVVQTEKNKDSKEVQTFNHTYYQGLLLEIGNMRHLDTYVPNQDKNKKFISDTLGYISSLSVIPHYSYDKFVERSSTIDVIWFNENQMPDSFFEVEHSTDIQNSLLKYNDLQDFYARMVIVADEHRRADYSRRLSFAAFEMLRQNNRVSFLSYESLDKQYQYELQKQQLDFIL